MTLNVPMVAGLPADTIPYDHAVNAAACRAVLITACLSLPLVLIDMSHRNTARTRTQDNSRPRGRGGGGSNAGLQKFG